MKSYKIAAIPGDGIGPEVIAAGLEVLEVCAERDGGFRLDVTDFDWGSDYYKRHGVMMPPGGHEQLRGFDAIYFGAVGAPDVPDHVTLWGLRLAICQPLDQYANVRPTRILPGITSPLRNVSGKELDWVIVRENSEGEYAGQGGRSHRGQPHEVATEVTIFTRAGVTRIMRYAFALARSRPRKLLTVVTKSNAQRHGMVMWDEIAAEVAAEFPDVTWDKMLVDAMTMRMTLKPGTLDTIVATNLHADILSDLAAALAGSLGIAPTANLNPERTSPSMFEPIHGSAFDITGKGVANPVATFWTGAMLLEHLGEKDAAARLMRAVERVTADPSAAHARSRRLRHDPPGHRRRDRGAPRRQSLARRVRRRGRRTATGPDDRTSGMARPIDRRSRAVRADRIAAGGRAVPAATSTTRGLLRAMFDAAVEAALPAAIVPRHLPAAARGPHHRAGRRQGLGRDGEGGRGPLAGPARGPGRHPLRPRRPLRADRDRRGLAPGARRRRPRRRPPHPRAGESAPGRTTSCSA